MKKIRILALAMVLVMTVLALSGCGLVDRVMGWLGFGDETDPEIRAVYDAYATYTAAAGSEPLDYETWLASIKGERGDSVSVTGCSKVATSSAGVTYRLSFSDGSHADFTVPPAGGDRAEDIEALLSLVTVEREPSRTAGQHTVTSSAASTTKDISSTFVGWSFYMTKTAMFGEADQVIGMYLNGFNLEAVDGVDTVEMTVEFLNIEGKESFLDADVVAKYITDVTPCGLDDYYVELYIEKADLAELGESFMIGLVLEGSPRVRMQISQNSSYVLSSDSKMSAKLANGTMAYSGYYTKSDTAGARVNRACSFSPNTPDIFFSSAIDERVTINGVTAGGSTGGSDAAVDGFLRLPEYYDLVVGDTFELFYKGISYCLDSNAYDYELSFVSGKNLGQGFSRKYIWTPTEADVGVHTLKIKVRSNEGAVIDEGTVDLRVNALPKSPEKEKVVLVIGDSLTSGGVWVSEFYRRLTGTGGTPAGDGLTNIKLIGTKGEDGALHEGYGGWTHTSFVTANKRNDQMILTGNFSDKNDAQDQHSSYKDANGQTWKIEYVTSTEMKIICTSATGKLPSTAGGTLTHSSGGVNKKDIVYTSARQADANPFWDATKGKNNFKAYAEKFGVKKIDEVIIFLGWNQTAGTLEAFEESAVKLIDSILAEYPDCHITLVTQQVPSRDGFANNYGISWPWFDKLDKIFDFQDIYVKLANSAKYRGSLSVVSVAGQFDTEYNEIKMTVDANNRNDTDLIIGSNGVHPSNSGYLQIADAVYRHMIHRLSK